MKSNLELRMYFFTVASLQGISKGIMCGHAAIEYAKLYGQTELFIDFANNWKTWIVLNGGTTNDEQDFDGVPYGTLNQIGDGLLENDIEFSYFREPDLNNALTALCFIADERVFNIKDYPNFKDWLKGKFNIILAKESIEFAMHTDEELIEKYHSEYKEWVRFIGGVKNEFLRDLLKGKKLA